MTSRALLLNASYEPLRVVDWKKALTLVFLNKVEVVEEYPREVRSISLTVKVPAVVRLLKFIRRIPRLKAQFSRTGVFARDQNVCQYDGREHRLADLTLDHVLPRSLGGRSSWENVVTCCGNCNRKKGGRTPEQAGLKLIRPASRPTGMGFLAFSIGLKAVPESWRRYLGQAPILRQGGSPGT